MPEVPSHRSPDARFQGRRAAAGRAEPLPSWSTLKAIADGQRQAMFALAAGFLALPVSLLTRGLGAEVVAWAFLAVTIAVRAWMAVAVYRLTRALGSRVALLWAIGAFLPNIIGLVVLAIASSRATRRLRAHGLKVGLMGASLPERPPPGFPCEELARDFA